MNAPIEFTTKLGVARRVERSRIWIEGKRLVDAGFTVGRYFIKEWVHPAEQKRTGYALKVTLITDDDIVTTMPCKVSGKGSKPIIDITGDDVRNAFPGCTHVICTYRDGVIEFRGSPIGKVK